MVKSTFTGKSTVDTIRNYAEMLIDDVNGNQPESLSSHWNKAREMDNATAKKIFSQEYGDRIGAAYFNCVKNYKISELKKCWKNKIKIDVNYNVVLKLADAKLMEIIDLIEFGFSMAPKSSDLHCAAAWAYIVHMGRGEPDNKKVDKLSPEALYEYYKGLAISHLSQASHLSPNSQMVMRVKGKLESLDRKKVGGGCFIATAAYGTPFANEIDVLRNWRDDFLADSSTGQTFIKAYYSLSPPIADNIRTSVMKRKLVRFALNPIVKILEDNYSN